MPRFFRALGVIFVALSLLLLLFGSFDSTYPRTPPLTLQSTCTEAARCSLWMLRQKRIAAGARH